VSGPRKPFVDSTVTHINGRPVPPGMIKVSYQPRARGKTAVTRGVPVFGGTMTYAVSDARVLREFARRLAALGAHTFKAKPGLGGRRHRIRRAKAVRS
jgi:hypothetical protein